MKSSDALIILNRGLGLHVVWRELKSQSKLKAAKQSIVSRLFNNNNQQHEKTKNNSIVHDDSQRYCTVPQMIPNPQMIPKMDRK